MFHTLTPNCEQFLVTDKGNPLEKLECIGNIADFLGPQYPCDDIYRYWVFRDPQKAEVKFYAFWDLGNGWWAGHYFVASDLIQLWNEITTFHKKEK